MKNNTLATLLLTSTLAMTSGAAFAADSASDNNGQANAAASAGQTAPDAKENIAPHGVDNSNINTHSNDTMMHPNGSSSDAQHMSKDEIHKNSMCKDGKCPDINKKVETGNGINNDVNTKTDGTTQ
ncbi:YbgS-like family protein [Serratia marcescens]|uniref:YbgS-like family protein n=1 Tax=Serratia marcescens TaxID=615 RepID=UPI000E2B9B37|nr:YbgS-like family protein [Serratia marcescens]